MSRGFAARKIGDLFVDPTNREDLATFQGLITVPITGEAALSHADFISEYNKWKKAATKKNKVYELNSAISVIRAALIVQMMTQKGIAYFVLFVKDLRILEGKLTSIPPHVVSPEHGGYVLNKATSLSERAGLKPSDILSGHRELKIAQVPDLLEEARPTAGDEAVDQMQDYLRALIAKKGTNYKIKNGAQFASLHQKYLGEWAAPIALITSQIEPKSLIPQIEENMLEGASVKKGKVIYNTNPAEALFDSLVDVSGMQIAISSKAHKGGGAAASLKGIHDTMVNKAHEFDARFWRTERNKKFKLIVDTIQNKSAIDGVLDLAVTEHILSQSDASRIKEAISSNVPGKLTQKTQRIMATYAANEMHPQYNQGKHALAAVARALCDQLNAEDYTQVAKAILNKSNVVQMMFVTGVSGPDLIAKHFQLIWPPKFDGNINFYSGKNFSATEIKGKLGFKIVKGATDAEPEPDESLQAPSLARTIINSIKQAANRAVGKVTTPGTRDKRDVKVPDKIALGRTLKPRS